MVSVDNYMHRGIEEISTIIQFILNNISSTTQTKGAVRNFQELNTLHSVSKDVAEVSFTAFSV